MTTATKTAPNHDKLTCYTDYHCRLPACVRRYNDRNNARLQAHRDGTWNRLVDAEPVRRHILRLQADGITPCVIAYTAGLPKQSVIGFIQPHRARDRGRQQRTSPDTAAKILAVTADNYTRGKVPSTGARRRIQALVAAGWPLKWIARLTGMSYDTISALLQRDVIYAFTAADVAAAYEQLADERPAGHGVDAAQTKRARAWATRRRWATTAYWARYADAIDDPHFEPMCGLKRREIVAQDAHWLMTTNGLSKAAAAERLGVDKSYVDHALRDHPEYAVEVAA
jgi:DNA-binding CsgD family transcriptional regulator